ncbi:unnamed protein product, partial [Gulo gulo]
GRGGKPRYFPLVLESLFPFDLHSFSRFDFKEGSSWNWSPRSDRDRTGITVESIKAHGGHKSREDQKWMP